MAVSQEERWVPHDSKSDLPLRRGKNNCGVAIDVDVRVHQISFGKTFKNKHDRGAIGYTPQIIIYFDTNAYFG